jgi:hypothetical protein
MRRHSIGVKQSRGRAHGLVSRAASTKHAGSIDRGPCLRYARAVSLDARRSPDSLRAARRPRVEVPPPDSERLSATKLVAIGAASACAGIALVLALSSRASPRSDRPTAEAVEARAIEAAPAAPVDDRRSAATVADTDSVADALAAAPEAETSAIAPNDASIAAAPNAEPSAGPEHKAPTAPPPAAEPTARPEPVSVPIDPSNAVPAALTERAGIEVIVGQVAYLRCDGLRPKRGAFPCPRDRALEKTIREIVAAIDRCRVADALGRGEFDIRLEIGAARPRPDIDVRAPTEAGERAVRACAASALAKVTTVLQPERMIVSQRFTVR